MDEYEAAEAQMESEIDVVRAGGQLNFQFYATTFRSKWPGVTNESHPNRTPHVEEVSHLSSFFTVHILISLLSCVCILGYRREMARSSETNTSLSPEIRLL